MLNFLYSVRAGINNVATKVKNATEDNKSDCKGKGKKKLGILYRGKVIPKNLYQINLSFHILITTLKER